MCIYFVHRPVICPPANFHCYLFRYLEVISQRREAVPQSVVPDFRQAVGGTNLVYPCAYPPAGQVDDIAFFVKTLFTAGSNIKNGKITASTAIDQLASGLTGSAALGLGVLLASGIGGIRLRGSDVDDDEKRRGQQTYSLEVGDYSYKIDWAAPANLPLFVGANLYDWKHRDGEDATRTSGWPQFLRCFCWCRR